jgi:hypothetical protein
LKKKPGFETTGDRKREDGGFGGGREKKTGGRREFVAQR